MKTPLKITT